MAKCYDTSILLQERLRQQREQAARRLGNGTAMEAVRQAAILKQEQAQIRGHGDSPPRLVRPPPRRDDIVFTINAIVS